MHRPAELGLRALPSIDALLRDERLAAEIQRCGRSEVTAALRAAQDEIRAALGRSAESPPGVVPTASQPGGATIPLQSASDSESLKGRVIEMAMARLRARSRPHLRRVINATGIVLHTGLGRAPLADAALAAVVEEAGRYCNLELDLASGERGDRHVHAAALLRELTGAEDALVVNNNAAATFLALNSLATGREVIVSRGQLVEIGGSYRMPDIMAAAGCRLREVGTTNRTHLRDYERAITADTGALLHVHTSNYRIQGFATAPRVADLVSLIRGRNQAGDAKLLVLDDLGSGLLDQPAAWGARSAPEWDEPSVRESVAAGADLTFFSGDKLLGGPQAGILVGRSDVFARLRGNPLMRTYRPDKLTLAALEATLRLYRDPQTAIDRVPTLRLLLREVSEIRATADRLAREIRAELANVEIEVVDDRSFAGGGSLPTLEFPTVVVRVRSPKESVDEFTRRLRLSSPAVVARISADAVVLDCRTISDSEISECVTALAQPPAGD